MSEDTTHLRADDRKPSNGLNGVRGWTGDSSWATDGRFVGSLVLLASLPFFWRLGSLAGVVSWGVIAIAWLIFPPIIPVAIGQFAIVALTATETGLRGILPAEAVLLALLIADLVDGNGWVQNESSTFPWPETPFTFSDIVVALSITTLSSAGLLLLTTETATLTAGVLSLGIFGTLSYGLHRYLLVDLEQIK